MSVGRRMRLHLLSLAGVCTLSFMASAEAIQPRPSQTTTTIPYRASCSRCELREERIARFGDPSDPVLLGTQFPVLNSRGEAFSASYDRSQVVRFAANGQYRGSFGRSGQGPGEFANGIVHIRVGPGDTLFVADGARRISVFSPSLSFLRTFNLPGAPADLEILRDGRILLSTLRARTPSSIGFPLHFLDSHGRVLTSFGSNNPDVRPGSDHPDAIAAFSLSSDQKHLWSFGGDYDAIRVRISDGQRDLLRVSGVPWLTDTIRIVRPRQGALRDQVRGSRAQLRGSAFVWGADSAGFIWATATVYSQSYTGSGPEPAPELFLEVFDPVRREMVLSRRMDFPYVLVGGTNMAFTLAINSDGIRTYTLYRVKVIRP